MIVFPENPVKEKEQVTAGRVVWFLNEPLSFLRNSTWQHIESLSRELIDIIGNSLYKHEVISARILFPILAKALEGREFSVVVNLVPTYRSILNNTFPQIPIVTIPISRVRESTTLETTGYKIGINETVSRRLNYFDFSHPLFFDDVGFTGGTQKQMMELLDVDPKEALHAFLIANKGDVEGHPGAVSHLQRVGAEVFAGKYITTPQDDCWHIEDLYGRLPLNGSHSFNSPLLWTSPNFLKHIDRFRLRQYGDEAYKILQSLQEVSGTLSY